MNRIQLHTLDQPLKKLIAVFMVVLTTGVLLGIAFIATNTQIEPEGLADHYRGSQVVDEFDVPEKYPKSMSSMLLNTHSHILSFAMIFFVVGAIFSLSTTLSVKWKQFFMIEPLLATLVTFGSLWGLRYISPGFSYLIVVSGILMYSSYFFMAGIIFYEVVFKKGS